MDSCLDLIALRNTLCSVNYVCFFAFFIKSIWIVPKLTLSLPSLSSNRIELWCNGNTADFGSVVPGSNPGSSTEGEAREVMPQSPPPIFFDDDEDDL